MAVLTTLNNTKYSEYDTRISSKRRRLAELSENDLVRINLQLSQWLLGVISGNSTISSAALTELESLYDEAITPPTSIISSPGTTANSRIGVGVTLTAGTNAITFASVFTSDDYALTLNTYTASGGQVQYTQDPTTRTVNGFTIWVAAACKLDYIATIL